MKDDSLRVKWVSTLIIGILTAYCGAVLIFMGFNGTNAYRDLDLYGETTEGTISRTDTQDSWKGKDKYLTVKYLVEGMEYSYVEKQGYFDRDAEEGDTLTVIYDPIQPLFAEEQRASFGQKWGYHFAGGGAAVLLGAGIAIYGVRLRKTN